MKKNQHQTVQSTSSGTLDKSSQRPTNRVQIPESDFEAPIQGVKGFIPNPTLDQNYLEKAAKSLLDKENEQEMELEEISLTPPSEEQMTIEKLAKRLAELESRGGSAGTIETIWARCITDGVKAVEIDEIAWTQLIRQWAKEPPTSVWYNGVRMFKKGTMEALLEGEDLSTDYVRGISNNKRSKNKFLGRS